MNMAEKEEMTNSGNLKKSRILTQKELQAIAKKLSHKKLSQQDSNRLSRQIRPKLREIAKIDAKELLEKLEYSQKPEKIENIIRKTILPNIKDISAIILYGSAIQTNYRDYRDIDILIVAGKEIYKSPIEKARKIEELKNLLEEKQINADIEIYTLETIKESYYHNPSLLYQLKDSKIIYGKISLLKKKRVVYNIELRMKLDWSDIADLSPDGNEIYQALRNIMLVMLLRRKIVDNKKLKESLENEIGKNLIEKLKNNKQSKIERKIALIYLNSLLKRAESEVKGGSWEKIELSKALEG